MPVLEVWSKQWLSGQFEYVPAHKASIFSVHLRLPRSVQQQIQMYSGQEGLYLEPRSIDGRAPSQQFLVVWTPGIDVKRLLMMKQSNRAVLGLARVGAKYGLRCRCDDARHVHEAVKPDTVFLPSGKKMTYMIGPFPWGSVKSSITAALHQAGWTARPLAAIPAGRGVDGTTYRVQAVQRPPSTTLKMGHGDVVVTRLDEEPLDHHLFSFGLVCFGGVMTRY